MSHDEVMAGWLLDTGLAGVASWLRRWFLRLTRQPSAGNTAPTTEELIAGPSAFWL